MKGKVPVACALILAVALCGCAAGRSVSPDNMLRSGFPRFEMKVAPGFIYAGNERKSEEVMLGVRYNMTQMNTERDYFVAATPDRRLCKLLVVETQCLLKGFWSIGPENVPNKLEEEKITLGGKRFTAVTRLAKFSCGPDADEMDRFLCGKGYFLPDCGLSRIASRIEGMDGEIMLSIWYFEDLKGSNFTSCGSWVRKELLVPGQLDHLKGFTGRFGTAFTMSD